MRVAACLLAASLVGLIAVTAAAEEPDSPAASQPAADEPAAASEETGAASEETGAASEETDAEDVEQPAPEDAEEDEDDPLPDPIPSATDTLSGHFVISASGLLSEPFGDLHDGVAQSGVFGTGYGGGLQLGYGVSRTVVLGLWAEGLSLGEGGSCADCSTTSFGVGPFIRYHLVQGVRFDPWISAGLGLRLTSVDTGDDKLAYTGLDLLHLEVGGDWYAWPNVGLGPFMGFNVTTYTSRPDDVTTLGHESDPGGAIGYAFTVGLRLSLDFPGK